MSSIQSSPRTRAGYSLATDTRGTVRHVTLRITHAYLVDSRGLIPDAADKESLPSAISSFGQARDGL